VALLRWAHVRAQAGLVPAAGSPAANGGVFGGAQAGGRGAQADLRTERVLQDFRSARGWAMDAQPLRVAEIDVDEVKAEGGMAGAWEVLFVSQSRGQVRRYIYSVIHRPARDLREGVNAEPPEAWSGRGDSEPFLFQAFKTDSPAAYEVAMKKSGDYARKNPGKEVKFLLEKTRRLPIRAGRCSGASRSRRAITRSSWMRRRGVSGDGR